MMAATDDLRRGRLVWRLARLAVWIFYRARRAGQPLPNGPVLLVANHPNSLMDPALVQITAGRLIRFLAKSTLFHGHLLSVFIRSSGAIPVYRRLDPGVDTSRNVEMFRAVEAALAEGSAICLFPEGISHSQGRLTELRTGAARIALQSEANGVHVAIMPIGLNFDRASRFRSRAVVVFGSPFWCDDLLDEYRRDAARAGRLLTDRIGEHLRTLVIEADPRSELEVVHRVDRLYATARGVSRDPEDQFRRRRLIASGMERLRQRDPVRYDDIRQRIMAYDAQLTRFGLRDQDVCAGPAIGTVITFSARELLMALLLGPVVLVAFVIFVAPYEMTAAVARRQRDLEVRATWVAVGGTFIYGIWVLALSLLAGQLAGRGAGVVVFCALPLLAVAGLFAFEREAAVLTTVRAYLAMRQAPLRARARLRRQRAQLASVLEEVYAWLRQSGT